MADQKPENKPSVFDAPTTLDGWAKIVTAASTVGCFVMLVYIAGHGVKVRQGDTLYVGGAVEVYQDRSFGRALNVRIVDR